MELLVFLFKLLFSVGFLAIIVLLIAKIIKSFSKANISSHQYQYNQQIADEDDNGNYEKLPYCRKYLLTKNEYAFYKVLKDIADKLNLTILAKVRLADLIEVNAEAYKNEYLKYFSKIQAKHIDFILCNKENLYPELLIELNDNSHKSEKRVERDDFIRRVLEKTGYKLLFVYGTGDLEQKITEVLKPEKNS